MAKMFWFNYKISTLINGEAEVRGGMIQARTAADAADILDELFAQPGVIITVLPSTLP